MAPNRDKAAHREYNRQWRAADKLKHPEKYLAYRERCRKWYHTHKETTLPKMREHYHAHKDIHHERHVRYRKNLRHRVIVFFGGKCSCCGEAYEDFLSLEHKQGGGRKHYAARGTWNVWRDAMRDPKAHEKYTILCHNCNFGKYRNGGTCPHQTEAYLIWSRKPR